MTNLSYEELQLVDGGSNLGNALIFIGGAIITVTVPGLGGIIAGTAISAVGLISGWE